jgi:hypothetical protein
MELSRKLLVAAASCAILVADVDFVVPSEYLLAVGRK